MTPKQFLVLMLSITSSLAAFADGLVVDHRYYEIRKGDFNDDKVIDLYMKQSPKEFPISDGSDETTIISTPIKSILLQQRKDHSFKIRADLSEWDLVKLDQWPLTGIESTSGDFNVDGVVDYLLEGVSEEIEGVSDQLVFARKDDSGVPATITALDKNLRKFFAEINNANYDRDYFHNYSIPVFETATKEAEFRVPVHCGPESTSAIEKLSGLAEELTSEAFLKEEIEKLEIDCVNQRGADVDIEYETVSIQWKEQKRIGLDSSHFSQEAIGFSLALDSVLRNWSLEDGSADKKIIESILEKMLRVDVFDHTRDDDEERQDLFVSVGYLARHCKGAEAIPMYSCPVKFDGVLVNICQRKENAATK